MNQRQAVEHVITSELQRFRRTPFDQIDAGEIAAIFLTEIVSLPVLANREPDLHALDTDRLVGAFLERCGKNTPPLRARVYAAAGELLETMAQRGDLARGGVVDRAAATIPPDTPIILMVGKSTTTRPRDDLWHGLHGAHERKHGIAVR
jgi:hypothetical protein